MITNSPHCHFPSFHGVTCSYYRPRSPFTLTLFAREVLGYSSTPSAHSGRRYFDCHATWRSGTFCHFAVSDQAILFSSYSSQAWPFVVPNIHIPTSRRCSNVTASSFREKSRFMRPEVHTFTLCIRTTGSVCLRPNYLTYTRDSAF